MTNSAPPIALTIAGSDSSAGAGIQADLKTMTSLGCYGTTVITCVVAEVPGRVLSIQAVTPQMIHDQLTILLEEMPVAAIKTGMLHSSTIIRTVASVLRSQLKKIPLVVDPVMVASSGDLLLEPDAIGFYCDELFPLASLVTPNLDELAILDHHLPSSFEEMLAGGKRMVERFKTSFLLKGGHLGDNDAVDALLMPSGEEYIFRASFQKDAETHGSGCTYSAAIAVGLAKGYTLPQAVEEGKKFITQAISTGYQWGKIGALNQGNYSKKSL